MPMHTTRWVLRYCRDVAATLVIIGQRIKPDLLFRSRALPARWGPVPMRRWPQPMMFRRLALLAH